MTESDYKYEVVEYSDELQKYMHFYSVANIKELIKAQADHIIKLQQKVRSTDHLIYVSPRQG